MAPSRTNADRWAPGELSGAERRTLAARARSLRPSVQIGARGLTDAIVAQVRQALAKHELIKIKVRVDKTAEADQIAEALVRRVPCHLIQRIGKVVIVFAPASGSSTP